jgi:hypothetical protein
MPDLETLAPGLLIAATAVVLLWFTFGTQANIRRGNRLLRWLQAGLPTLGPTTTLRWLGSSVAELKIVNPSHPFREALVLVVLEPRDLGALWALARSRGRRDFIVFRLSLVRSPLHRADAVDPRAWTAGHLADAGDSPEGQTSWTDASGVSVELRHDPDFEAAILERLWVRLSTVSGGIWRISIRPTIPHLEIHLIPPDPDASSARELLGEVREIAVELIPAR